MIKVIYVAITATCMMTAIYVAANLKEYVVYAWVFLFLGILSATYIREN